jgi:hypothetical protein
MVYAVSAMQAASGFADAQATIEACRTDEGTKWELEAPKLSKELEVSDIVKVKNGHVHTCIHTCMHTYIHTYIGTKTQESIRGV